MKEKFLILWHQQTERDKRVLLIGTVIIFFCLFYTLGYLPLRKAVLAHQLKLREDQVTLTWMEEVRPLAHSLQKKADKVSASQLLSIISDELHDTPFKGYVYQLQQAGDHEVQLSYEMVPYNFFLTWLSEFSKRHTFNIIQLHVIKQDETAGIVKVMLLIEASE